MALTDLERKLLSYFDNDCDLISSDEEYWKLCHSFTRSEPLFYLPWILNWDDDRTDQTIWWILEHHLCDAGIAMAIYWLNNPSDWIPYKDESKVPEYGKDAFRMVHHIQKRMEHYQFPHVELSYDPAWHWKLTYSQSVGGGIPQHISWLPEFMRRPTPGEPIASDIFLRWW